jgi:hypothetical protein
MCYGAVSGQKITELTYVSMFNNAYYIPDFREATRYFWR